MAGHAMQEFDLAGPSRRRSLDGVTILLVEDSLSASEAIRLMALSCGARLRRADSMETGLQHLAMYRPDVTIIDLGLPDGNGLEMIRAISADAEQDTHVIAISGADGAEWSDPARDAGAAAIMTKPIDSVDRFQDTIVACLPDAQRRREWKRATRIPASDGESMTRDIWTITRHLTDAIAASDMDAMRYCGRFIEGLARSLEQAELRKSARRLYSRDLDAAARVKLAEQVLTGVSGLTPVVPPENP